MYNEPSKLHLPGQPSPPDTANPVQVQTDPTNGLTVARHINGTEVVFLPDGAFGVSTKNGMFIQLRPDGVMEFKAKTVAFVTEEPMYHVLKKPDGTVIQSQVQTNAFNVIPLKADPSAPQD